MYCTTINQQHLLILLSGSALVLKVHVAHGEYTFSEVVDNNDVSLIDDFPVSTICKWYSQTVLESIASYMYVCIL